MTQLFWINVKGAYKAQNILDMSDNIHDTQ